MIIALVPQVTSASPFYRNYGDGTIAGATLANLANITYSDLGSTAGLSPSSVTTKVSGFIPGIAIRVPTSIRAAVILMDTYDSMWTQRFGHEVFTGVPGTGFNSYTVDQFSGYFNGQSDSGIPVHIGGTVLNQSDGDLSGNVTLTEKAFPAAVDYSNVNSYDYQGVNVSEMENLPDTYSKITNKLLDHQEVKSDWQERGNTIVSAYVSDIQAATIEQLKARVALIDTIPISQVRIDNYTVSDVYLEKVISGTLSKDVVDAAKQAGSQAGLLDTFKNLNPIKVAADTIDAAKSAASAYKTSTSSGGSFTDSLRAANDAAFESVRGSTSYAAATALKDQVISGAKSTWTGLKAQANTAYNKIKSGVSGIVGGTKKLFHKVTGWFASLSEKAQKIIKIVLIVVILAVIAYLLFWLSRLKMMRSMGRSQMR